MMTEDDFNAGAQALADANGLSLEIAEAIMEVIGDTPEADSDGLVTVVADGVTYRVFIPMEDAS